MASVADQVARQSAAQRGVSRGGIWRAKIAKGPLDLDDLVEVTIPDFDPKLRFGRCRWEPRAAAHAHTYSPPDTAWHVVGTSGEPAFQNGWVQYPHGSYDRVRYRKTSAGIVLCEGLVVAGASSAGLTIFTLPVGYRPQGNPDASSRDHIFDAASSVPAAEQIRIDSSTGGLRPMATVTSGHWIALEGVVFFAGPDLTLNFSHNPPLPQRGDDCIVAFDSRNEVWILSWWPF